MCIQLGLKEKVKTMNVSVFKFNRGSYGLRANEEMWSRIQKIDGGKYEEDDESIIITSTIGESFKFTKTRLAYSARNYSPTYTLDEDNFEIYDCVDMLIVLYKDRIDKSSFILSKLGTSDQDSFVAFRTDESSTSNSKKIPELPELSFYSTNLTDRHIAIANFFNDTNKFGIHPPLMTYFSTLKPSDRCAILEVIFARNHYNSYDLIMDKLMLAYCKDGNIKGSDAILEHYHQNGSRQEMMNHLVYLKQEFGPAPYRSDEERILFFENYERHTTNSLDLSFLGLLRSFVLGPK